MVIHAATSSLLQDSRGSCTYPEVRQGAARVASRLLENRASLEGRRVAILCEAGTGFVQAFAGALQAGGCAVVLSALHPASESAYFVQDSQASVLLASRAMTALARSIAPGLPLIEIEDALARQQPQATPAIQPDPESAALQLYTSGTTGKPKGAVLTHANLATQQRLLGEAWEMRTEDVLLHVLPLHHMHGLCIALLNALGAGAGVRFVEQFDTARAWEEMGRASVFMAVPTIYAKLLAAYDAAAPETRERWQKHARALRLATSGSAALPVTLAERWRAITGLIPLERFGMTELGVALSNPLRGPRKAGSVGLPLPTVQARIVDESGRPAEQGELWISGPSVFAGYHRRAEATAQAFAELEGARYFRTGDTVTKDEDGYFRILGRTSVDILKSGGYKLSALEIEETLREHPGVAEVAVVGVPDEVWGDRVVACVIARSGTTTSLDESALREFARTRMAPYKVPKQVLFMKELPRNAMGKVLKPELAKLASSHAQGEPT